MFSFSKLLVFAAPLISLVAANHLPAPVRSSQLSQPYIKGTSKDAGSSSNSSISANAVSDCDHCYTCFTFFTPSGSKFLAFVGNMVVPNNDPVNSAATNFVWPGLQNNQNDQGGLFVLQPVLNGFPADNGQWSTFQNYLVGGTFDEKTGTPVGVSVGQSLPFSMKIASDGQSWDISGAGATNNYPITQDLIEALFCGEFYKSNWYFGDLVFTDVQMVASGSDSSWCVEGGNNPSGVTGQWEGISIDTDENGNTVCNVSKLTMQIAQ